MARKISVIIKRPGKKPYHTNISNTLENLQKTVDGYIEVVRIASNACFIVDEEARLKGLPYNFSVCGTKLFGTAVFCGVVGEDFTDMPATFEQAKRLFPGMWVCDDAVI